MIGIDTNILVRYLVQDDAKQARLATSFIETQCTVESPGYLNKITLCELVWVFESAYKYAKNDIVYALEAILRTKQFQVEDQEVVWQAINQYKQDAIDFADCMIAADNQQLRCCYTATFDKQAAKIKWFKLLG